MCAGCHLSPGVAQLTLVRAYIQSRPTLPRLILSNVIKQTVQSKAFGRLSTVLWHRMPAWGASHDDDRMWAMVAFIRSLPELDESQYRC